MFKKYRIFLIFVAGTLAALILIPNLIRTRTCSSPNACLANLKQIQEAKATWAFENHKKQSDIPNEAELFGVTNHVRELPTCPAGGTYSLGRTDQRPRCSSPGHEVFLACAMVVDESDRPLAEVGIEGLAESSHLLRGKTGGQGFTELSSCFDSAAEHWKHGSNRFVVTKAGYRTEKLPMPDMWPLRVVLKRE